MHNGDKNIMYIPMYYSSSSCGNYTCTTLNNVTNCLCNETITSKDVGLIMTLIIGLIIFIAGIIWFIDWWFNR